MPPSAAGASQTAVPPICASTEVFPSAATETRSGPSAATGPDAVGTAEDSCPVTVIALFTLPLARLTVSNWVAVCPVPG